MELTDHYGLLRPLRYDNLIASDWNLWSRNQMGILDNPLFHVYEPRLLTHAQKIILSVKEHKGVTISARITRGDGMLRVQFFDDNEDLIELNSLIRSKDFPKMKPISARSFLELINRVAAPEMIHTREFYALTAMMLEDFNEENLIALVKSLPWLLLTNSKFEQYVAD